MPQIDVIKAHLFAKPMPDMPPKLREIWQVAFMLRRKYSDPADKDADTFFANALSDMQFITETYGNSEMVRALMLEVYSDIERQWKVTQARLEQNTSD